MLQIKELVRECIRQRDVEVTIEPNTNEDPAPLLLKRSACVSICDSILQDKGLDITKALSAKECPRQKGSSKWCQLGVGWTSSSMHGFLSPSIMEIGMSK